MCYFYVKMHQNVFGAQVLSIHVKYWGASSTALDP